MTRPNAILTDPQEQLLASFARSALSAAFVLSGGTALSAFHLRHRLSDDLDFFSFGEVDGFAVRGFLRSLTFVRQYAEQHIFDRNIFLLDLALGETLKVEFTRYPFPSLDPPIEVDALRVDSLRDIAANKVAAFCDRRDAKDAIDVYALLTRDGSLKSMILDAQRKFGIAGLQNTLEARLLAVDKITAWPVVTFPFAPTDLVRRFRAEAEALVRERVEASE